MTAGAAGAREWRFRRVRAPGRARPRGRSLDEAAVARWCRCSAPAAHRERRDRLPACLSRPDARAPGARHPAGRAAGAAITLAGRGLSRDARVRPLSTACANAYVQPIMAGYLGRSTAGLRRARLRLPAVHDDLGRRPDDLEISALYPVRLVANPVRPRPILAAHLARECGFDRVLSFDRAAQRRRSA